MKRKIIAALVIVMALAVLASADTFTLLSAKSAEGAGAAVKLAKPLSSWTCSVSYTGAEPTAVVVALSGSVNGSAYGDLYEHTVTDWATGAFFSVWGKPVNYVRGNLKTLTTSGVTAITMSCVGD
ncbi:secreted protein [Candidatus Magnetoovum chiemensis]|nr:secreted protein [Candidatus Magnetoovum chiemensis]